MSGAGGHTPGPLKVSPVDGGYRIDIVRPWGNGVEPGTAPGVGDYRGVVVASIRHGTPGSVPDPEHAEANAQHMVRVWDLDPEAVQRLVEAVDEVLAWMRGPARAYGLETERWEAHGLDDEHAALAEARAAFRAAEEVERG